MIDVWYDLFDEVARAILAVDEDAYVTSVYELAPPSFPAVSITMLSNVEVSSMVDSSGEENGNELTVQCDVYTEGEDAPQDGMDLLLAADTALRFRNFRRTYMAPVLNAADPNIHRYTARYTAVVDKNLRLYGGR